MLYEPERHEPLTANAWNEHTARACIDEIFGDAVPSIGSRLAICGLLIRTIRSRRTPSGTFTTLQLARSGRCAV
jgi:hypothetical protein